MIKRGFHSSPGKTPEFLAFARTFRSEFKKELQALGCTEPEFHTGHFEMSGFFNSADGQLWYFSIGDVRWMIGGLQMLVRTAQHRKDYHGGQNQSARLEAFSESLGDIIRQTPTQVD